MSKGKVAFLAILIGIVIGVSAILLVGGMMPTTQQQSSAETVEYTLTESDPGVIHEYTIKFDAKENGKLCLMWPNGAQKAYWYDTEEVDMYYYYKAGHNEVKCLTRYIITDIEFTRT